MSAIPHAAQKRVKFESRRPNRPDSAITQLIVHTAVDGKGDHSLLGYFNRVGWATTAYINKHGIDEQYLDTNRKPSGTRDADTRAITWETEDDGQPELVPWTSAQIQTLIRDLAWACRRYNIPPRLIEPDRRYGVNDAQRWRNPGIGYHSLPGFTDPINKTGVLRGHKIWTKYPGKTCPGKLRTRQLVDVVIPAVAQIVGGGAPLSVAAPAVALKYGVSALRDGDKGDAVKTLQTVLNLHGAGVVVDGDFGPNTTAAVRKVQALLGVTVDGIWGSQSAAASYLTRKGRTSGWPTLTQPSPPPPPPDPDPPAPVLDLAEIRADVDKLEVGLAEVKAKLG